MSETRTLFLRERLPRECRLSRADVDLLVADHRPHVAVVPTHRRGRYHLTPTDHVGTITLPSLLSASASWGRTRGWGFSQVAGFSFGKLRSGTVCR